MHTLREKCSKFEFFVKTILKKLLKNDTIDSKNDIKNTFRAKTKILMKRLFSQKLVLVSFLHGIFFTSFLLSKFFVSFF